VVFEILPLYVSRDILRTLQKCFVCFLTRDAIVCLRFQNIVRDRTDVHSRPAWTGHSTGAARSTDRPKADRRVRGRGRIETDDVPGPPRRDQRFTRLRRKPD